MILQINERQQQWRAYATITSITREIPCHEKIFTPKLQAYFNAQAD
jgi:hypothetical protein